MRRQTILVATLLLAGCGGEQPEVSTPDETIRPVATDTGLPSLQQSLSAFEENKKAFEQALEDNLDGMPASMVCSRALSLIEHGELIAATEMLNADLQNKVVKSKYDLYFKAHIAIYKSNKAAIDAYNETQSKAASEEKAENDQLAAQARQSKEDDKKAIIELASKLSKSQTEGHKQVRTYSRLANELGQLQRQASSTITKMYQLKLPKNKLHIESVSSPKKQADWEAWKTNQRAPFEALTDSTNKLATITASLAEKATEQQALISQITKLSKEFGDTHNDPARVSFKTTITSAPQGNSKLGEDSQAIITGMSKHIDAFPQHEPVLLMFWNYGKTFTSNPSKQSYEAWAKVTTGLQEYGKSLAALPDVPGKAEAVKALQTAIDKSIADLKSSWAKSSKTYREIINP